MFLRPATLADIPAILAIESLPEYRAFIGQWSEDRHRATLTSTDARYFVVDAGGSDQVAGRLAAYAILRGFAESSSAIELKRIAVRTPQRGLGRQILAELIRVVFEEHNAHRLFLDVFESNTRARHLYESLGFVYEGTLREAAFCNGEYHNLCLMSLLDREYAARKAES